MVDDNNSYYTRELKMTKPPKYLTDQELQLYGMQRGLIED